MRCLPVTRLRAILAAGLMAARIAGQDLNPDSGAPDMTSVQDVLHGQRHLLRKDDIGLVVVSQPGSTANTSIVIVNTENSGFGTRNSYELTSGVPSNTPAHTSVATGRMYNNANDVILTVPMTPNWQLNLTDSSNAGTLYSTAIGDRFTAKGQA